MNNEKSVPKLRFVDESDEWDSFKLGDVLDKKGYIRGPFGSALKRGEMKTEGIPVYEQQHAIYDNRLFRYYIDDNKFEELKRFQVIPNDLIVSCSGTIGKTSLIRENDEKGIISQALLILRSNSKIIEPKFLKYFLETNKGYNSLISSAGGSSQVNIAKKQIILDIPLVVPRLPTQHKIINFLDKISYKIELLEHKYEKYQDFKKYLMQQIFAQKLRFDFDEEWREVKLKDIVERVTRKNTNLETDLALTISAEYGLIDQEEFFNKVVASKSLKNYYLIKNGEFAYNKSYSNGYPYGAIKRLDDYSMGALSTLYICFKPTDVSSDYLKEYFETTFWYKEIYSIAVEGARNHGLLNINVNDFFNTKHLIPPSTEEQEKIADLFKSINSKIDAVNIDLNLVKNFKKGLLQQMFV